MAVVSEEQQTDRATALWQCQMCGFVYDPRRGDPDGGIPPGTAFDDIPDDWVCPSCGARKADFMMMSPGDDYDEAATQL